MKNNAFSMSKVLSWLSVPALMVSTAFAYEGGDHSGGGDSCLLRLNAVADIVRKSADQLSSLEEAGISRAALIDALSRVRFETEDALTKDGTPVDALNFPDQSLIMVDRARCAPALEELNGAMSFLVHETLGLMKADDSEYRISRKVLNELNQIVVARKHPSWKYVCAIQRHHYSSTLLQQMHVVPNGAGYEILDVVDTYNGYGSSGYLYGRVDRQTDDYVVMLETNATFWGEEPSRLFYTLYYDKKHKADQRRILADHVEVDFNKPASIWEKPGKRIIRLLDGDAFRDGNSFLQMECYRTI